jgi:hypothetical protein
MNRKSKLLLMLLCLFTILSDCLPSLSMVVVASQNQEASFLKYEVKNPFLGRLTQIIQIDNPTLMRITGANIIVPVIRNETAHNYVLSCSITSKIGMPTIIEDESGNWYASWTNVVIDRMQTLSLNISYVVLSFETRYIVDSESTGKYDTNSDFFKKYTQSEELIESNASEIILKAQSLVEDHDDLHDKISRLYNFVASYVRYVPQDGERGALWALENAAGDCSEFSYLFVALCRAVGVPARVQTGFAFHYLTENLEDGHMWAEYYLENYGWIPVDATWGQLDILDEKHFGSLQSMPELIPYSNYFFNYTEGPNESEIKSSQQISLSPSPTEVSGSNVEMLTMAVQKIERARSAIYVEKILGMPLIFPSDAAEADQALLDGEVKLQSALEQWDEHPQNAQTHLSNAVENGEKALQKGWMLVGYAFAIFIFGSVIALLAALVYFDRHVKSRMLS